MPRRSRARRADTLARLNRIDRAPADGGCIKLIHIAIGSEYPPSVTPGCAECERVRAEWEALPKRAPEPKKYDDQNNLIDDTEENW